MHAAGWLESALLASYEKFIIDVEQLRMFEWILTRGLPVDEEGMAMDALREVGPGGHFLGAEHTLRNYRTGFYRPWISSTGMPRVKIHSNIRSASTSMMNFS